MDFNFGSEGSASQFDLPFKTAKVQFDFIDTNKVTDYHRNNNYIIPSENRFLN